MSYSIKAEKTIGRPPSVVFQAIGQGRLFLNCGADSGTAKVDFRVGGKFHIDFKNHKVSNWGEFLEIVPDKKIVFSWCQTFGADQKPDTKVTIQLAPDGANTKLLLTHEGFATEELREQHNGGWNAGIGDLSEELQVGRLRMVRNFEASIENVYETCKDPSSFFGFMGDLAKGSVDFRVGGKYQLPTKKGQIKGEFLEIVPNKKITISWLDGCGGPFTDSKVTLTLKSKDQGSSLELIHEGLNSEEAQKACRQGWEHVTEKMSETLGRDNRFQ